MKLLAVLEEAAFNDLPDATVMGKDSYIKNDKDNTFKLALNGEEAGKLALPLQTALENKKKDLERVHNEKKDAELKLQAFEAVGKTPEEIVSIIETGKTEGVDAVEKKYQEQLERQKNLHQSALDAAKGEVEAAKNSSVEIENQLQNHMKRTQIAETKNKFGMNALGDDYMANRTKVIKDEDSGDYVTRIIENGEIASKAGRFKTLDDLAEEARTNKELAGMFNAGTGGGSGGDGRQKPYTGGGNRYEGMSSTEKLKAARRDGVGT